jgi:SOS-response transcriptional repressor LexA
LVHLEILDDEERNAVRKDSIIELPPEFYKDESKLCRVRACGPDCRASDYATGDLVLVPRTMEIVSGRGILVQEQELLCRCEIFS